MKELISVIVPVYNIENYVERCIESIISQTYSDLEIIVVDDGSTDGSGAMCDTIAQRDVRISVIHKTTNGGLAAARNTGIDACVGNYVAFIDGDDYIDPDMIEVMHNAMRDDVSCVTVGFVEHEGDSISRRSFGSDIVEFDSECAIRDILEEGIINESACNKLYKKNIFDSLRYRIDVTSEDAEIISKIIDKCNKIIVLDSCKYHYVRREGSLTRMPFTKYHFESLVSFHEIVKTCEKNYQKLLGLAYYYELKKNYGTLAEIYLCKKKTRFVYSLLIRLRMIGLYYRAYSDVEVKKKYGDVKFRYLVPILTGYRISELIGSISNHLD